MRTIKFRAFDDGKMIYENNILHLKNEDNLVLRLAKFWCNIRNDSHVMQFTGLHDKNGKEIYEGDIVNWGMHHPNSEERFHRYAIVDFNPDIQFKIIFYINSQNGVKKETDGHIFRFGQFAYKETEKHLQVLGNVYENPELLTD